MTIRGFAVRGLAVALGALLAAGCSKTDEAKQTPVPVATAVPAPSPATPPQAAAPLESGRYDPAAAAERQRLEDRAAAAEARARLAEIEMQERSRQDAERAQMAAQAEAARAAVLAEQARALSIENAVLRAQAEDAAQAESAAYGTFGGPGVIIVQPPQRGGYGRPPFHPPGPPKHEPPPQGAGTTNIGLRPAVPDLTPPGAPAPLQPFKFDTLRPRKTREDQAKAEP